MLCLAIASSGYIMLVYFSFFTAMLFSALCIILMFVLIYKKQSGVFVFALFLLLCTIISSAFSLSQIERVEKLDGITASCEFLCVECGISNGSQTVIAEVKNGEYFKKNDKILCYYGGAELKEGQSFKANVKLSCFDAAIRLNYYSKGVYIKGNLSKIILTNNNDFVLSGVSKLKAYIKTVINNNLEKEQAATMLALIMGDDSYFSKEFYGNVKSAGVAHVMVVSGMHLSVIVTFATFILNKFFYNRYFKAFMIFATVIAVFTVCGFTMSIMRAGITYLLVAVSFLLNRKSNPLNNLGTAVSIILIFSPLAIFNIAFQLSVLSTFGILAAALPITEFLKKSEIIRSEKLLGVVSAVLLTLSAMLFTLPIAIMNFGYVSNMAVITNLLIALPTTFSIYLCIAGLILIPLRPLIFFVNNCVLGYINWVINFFGSADFAVRVLPKWAIALSLLAIFLIIFALLACVNQKNMLKLREIIDKKIKEGGGKRKWLMRKFLNKK